MKSIIWMCPVVAALMALGNGVALAQGNGRGHNEDEDKDRREHHYSRHDHDEMTAWYREYRGDPRRGLPRRTVCRPGWKDSSVCEARFPPACGTRSDLAREISYVVCRPRRLAASTSRSEIASYC